MDIRNKANRIRLLNFSTPQMRAFHLSWFAFHICFFGWFGIAPLMAADPTLWQVPHAFGVLPFDMAFMSGKPHVVEHVLKHYFEQLLGLPKGTKQFLDCSGKKGLAAGFAREEMERSQRGRTGRMDGPRPRQRGTTPRVCF